jgi:hypothetical protein
VQPYHFLDRVDAYKPVSTAKLMAQKPNCNPKLRHKNSVFSVPIIVTTSIIYYGICDFFDWIMMIHRSPNSLITMIFNAQIAIKIHQKVLAAGGKAPDPTGGAHNAPPDTLVVYWSSAPDPARELTALPRAPCRPVSSPPSFVYFKPWLDLHEYKWGLHRLINRDAPMNVLHALTCA